MSPAPSRFESDETCQNSRSREISLPRKGAAAEIFGSSRQAARKRKRHRLSASREHCVLHPLGSARLLSRERSASPAKPPTLRYIHVFPGGFRSLSSVSITHCNDPENFYDEPRCLRAITFGREASKNTPTALQKSLSLFVNIGFKQLTHPSRFRFTHDDDHQRLV